MKNRTHLISIICILIILLMVGCSSKNVESKSTASTNFTHTISQSKDDEILYGKYPTPILIAIGENNQVNKDCKKLTRGDLDKVENLYFSKEYGFDYVAKKYGFKEKEEYDFSIILEMPNLEALSIDFGASNIRLKDYSILKNLKNMKRLTVNNIHDTDMANITDIKSLEWLSIVYSDITNIDFLEKLYNLKTFTLEHCYNIKNYEALSCLNIIELINLTNMNITEKELNTFPDLPSLKSLGLVGNCLTNIIDFPKFINLESLTISENPLERIKVPLNSLPKIKNLGISKTPISDANEISGFDTIENIYMYDTKITKLAPFKKYKKLKSINTKLADIEDKETLDGTNINIIQD